MISTVDMNSVRLYDESHEKLSQVSTETEIDVSVC